LDELSKTDLISPARNNQHPIWEFSLEIWCKKWDKLMSIPAARVSIMAIANTSSEQIREVIQELFPEKRRKRFFSYQPANLPTTGS